MPQANLFTLIPGQNFYQDNSKFNYILFIDDLNFPLPRLSINFYTQSDHEILKNFYSNIVKLSLINSSEFT